MSSTQPGPPLGRSVQSSAWCGTTQCQQRWSGARDDGARRTTSDRLIRSPWVAALVAVTLLRLGLAATIPLAPDEAYYWVWSRALSAGYLDHPPMVALWIRAGTLFAGETPFGIRLLGPVSAAIGSILLADAADRLVPGRGAGWWAAALLNATLLFGVGSILITPDTPLLFCWTGSLWAAVRAAQSGRTVWWAATGVWAGLAMASKYTAILLWVGLALWVLVVPSLRAQLRRPGPWVAVLAAVAVFAPVIAWNAAHGWVSFLRQGSRAGDWRANRAVEFVTELVGGQIALVTPVIFVLCITGITAATRLAWRRELGATLLVALTFPGALLFLQHAAGDRVQGNWPAILYPAGCIAAAGLTGPRLRKLRPLAAWTGVACNALVYLQAVTGVLPIPARRDPIALQLSGWDTLANQVDSVREASGARYIVADQYAVASELAYLSSSGLSVLGSESRWALTVLPRGAPAEGPGLLVSHLGPEIVTGPAGWTGAALRADIDRGPVERLHLYLVTAPPPNQTWAILPRPGSTHQPGAQERLW